MSLPQKHDPESPQFSSILLLGTFLLPHTPTRILTQPANQFREAFLVPPTRLRSSHLQALLPCRSSSGPMPGPCLPTHALNIIQKAVKCKTEGLRLRETWIYLLTVALGQDNLASLCVNSIIYKVGSECLLHSPFSQLSPTQSVTVNYPFMV